MATFDQLMQGFGVVTVMNACIYKLKDNKTYVGRGSCQHGSQASGAFLPSDFECTGLYLDTLKIANFTQEGPTKTITGGQYANPLIKYGKTMTCEMQDALGRAAVLKEFFGCDYDESGRLSITDKFPGAFAIEGDTFFIDQKTGEKVDVHILIPQFLPDAILTLTQDAEGDATVFDLNGSVSVTKIADPDEANTKKAKANTTRDVFYEIRRTPWFAGVEMVQGNATNGNYHGNDATAATVVRFYVGDNLYYVTESGDEYVAPQNPQAPFGYQFNGWSKKEKDQLGDATAITAITAPADGDVYYASFSLKQAEPTE